jgi:hypothetical protein
MKTGAEKSSRSASRTASPAAEATFFARPRPSAPPLQAKLTVNQPGDAFEQEADRMADRVTRMPAPAATGLRRSDGRTLRRATDDRLRKAEDDKLRKADEDKLRKAEDDRLRWADDKLRKAEVDRLRKKERAGDGGAIGPGLQAAIQSRTAGGQPLSSDVRGQMETGFDADFGKVRVHRDAEAASLSNQLSARAFTYRNHIFFGRDQYQPGDSGGRRLLAHELTHTIQQGHSVQRSQQVGVATATPAVQRLGVEDALDSFADLAYAIPGFRLLTLVLGFHPISMRTVERSAANLLRAMIEVLPGGFLITRILDSYGLVNRAAAWMEERIAVLGGVGAGIASALRRFLDSLSWTEIVDLDGVWDRARRVFTEPIDRVVSFAAQVASGLLGLVRDAILRPLAALAKGTAGYDLLGAILGFDPISGEPVQRNAETVIGGFMRLIGQEEIWENIKRGNAVERAWAWFQGALAGLLGFVRSIPGRILDLVASLTFEDVVTVVGAFGRVVGAFASIAVEFMTWAGARIWNLLEIIFDVVKPGLMGYVRRTGAALRAILQNPMPFLGNLIRAARLGFETFVLNFVVHLRTGLIDWLTGSLEGVYIPQSFNLIEFGKFALSVLGVTWRQIRAKIVRALGPAGEAVMQGLESAFDIVRALVTGGVGAVWDLIKERLAGLKDQLIDGIIDFVKTNVITRAVTRLVSMFVPGAGFITAIASIYDTVMVFVDRLSRIVQVVTAFIDSIVTIAAGNVSAAANRVERILAGLLSLAISFLAGFVGLGRVTDRVMGIVRRVQASVDRALDVAVSWVVARARAFIGAIRTAMRNFLQWWRKRLALNLGGERHSLEFEGEGRAARFVIRSAPETPSRFLARRFDTVRAAGKTEGPYIANTQAREGEINQIQAGLPARESDHVPLTGTARADADAKMGRMDAAIAAIGTNVTGAYAAWDLAHGSGELVGTITLGRGSFSRSDKKRLAEHHRAHLEGFRVEGRAIPRQLVNPDGTFKPGASLARRHVVSSQDMIDHYTTTLRGKTVPEASLLLSQRASIPEARKQVTGRGTAGVEAAARARYNGFFSYVNNLFIGDARSNSSIGRLLDPHHPGLVEGGRLGDHVARIKREWSFGTGFTPTEPRSNDTFEDS